MVEYTLLRKHWKERALKRNNERTRELLSVINESILDDLELNDASSSQKLAEQTPLWQAHFILTAIGNVYVTEERHFLEEAEKIPFVRMAHQWQDVIDNCAFVRDSKVDGTVYCSDALIERIKKPELFSPDYLEVDLTGEDSEHNFVNMCKFALEEKHAICPNETTAKVVISLSCSIMLRQNVTLRQIIRSFKNIKRFSSIFSDVMRDLLINMHSITLKYIVPGQSDKNVEFFIDEKLGVSYGTLYKLAANITGDEERYSKKNLERDYKKVTPENPDEFSVAISENVFVPEFIKKIARDMQADPDFDWSIAGYKKKDVLNSFPLIILWVKSVNPKKNKVSVLRNRLRSIFTGFTYFELKEIRALFKSNDVRRQLGMYVYVVFNTDEISLPESQCSPDKTDYEFKVMSDATDFNFKILNAKFYQFNNSMKSNSSVDAFYRRYTTIERIVSSNDLKYMEDLLSLNRIQGELVELSV